MASAREPLAGLNPTGQEAPAGCGLGNVGLPALRKGLPLRGNPQRGSPALPGSAGDLSLPREGASVVPDTVHVAVEVRWTQPCDFTGSLTLTLAQDGFSEEKLLLLWEEERCGGFLGSLPLSPGASSSSSCRGAVEIPHTDEVVVHSWGGGSASHSTGREGLQVWDGACWARMDLGGSWRRQESTAGLKPRVELLLLQSEWNSLATSPQTGDQQKQLGRKSCFGWDLEGSELEIHVQGLTLSACLVFRSYR